MLGGFIAGMACLAVTNASAGLVIVKAVFGDLSNPAATADVTTNVAAMVQNDELSVEANITTFGDPAFGIKKQLRVDYTIDGVAGSKLVPENNRLKITTRAARLVVVKAVYGNLSTPDATADVTTNVAAMVQDDELGVDANIDTFGDPAPGFKKQLRVDYTIDGVAGSKLVLEDNRLRVTVNDKPGLSRLVIRKAEYGNLADGKVTDVTALVAGMVVNDAVEVVINNDLFGDPAPEELKRFRIDYTLNGEKRSRTLFEGSRLRISTNDKPAAVPQPGSSKLVIRKAEYGDLPDGHANDVTELVAAMVANDALDVKVSDDDFGNPEPAALKKLRVDYTFDGVDGSKTVYAGARMTVSAGDLPAPSSQWGSHKLVILAADYGDLPDGNAYDVTEMVAAMVRGNNLKVMATNDNFGDPAIGAKKELQVDYSFNGKLKSKTVEEGQFLTIDAASEEPYQWVWFAVLGLLVITPVAVLIKVRRKKRRYAFQKY